MPALRPDVCSILHRREEALSSDAGPEWSPRLEGQPDRRILDARRRYDDHHNLGSDPQCRHERCRRCPMMRVVSTWPRPAGAHGGLGTGDSVTCATLCEVFRSTDALLFTADQIESRPVRFSSRGFTEPSGLRSLWPQGRGGSSPLFRTIRLGRCAPSLMAGHRPRDRGEWCPERSSVSVQVEGHQSPS